jgi:hypothetical protein
MRLAKYPLPVAVKGSKNVITTKEAIFN